MTDPNRITLSVVMPAYNEEAGIEEAVQEIQEEVLAVVPDAELCVVDDGSRDRTGEILDRVAKEDPRIRVIHQANTGHGRALRAGLDSARGEYVLLIDSDRQIPLSAFEDLWGGVDGRDGVFGVRRVRYDPALRLRLTALVRWMLCGVLRVDLYDANVPFKLVRRWVWLDAREVIPEHTLAPSLFLAVYMKRTHCSISEVEVAHRERATGQSINGWKLFKFCLRGLFQLLAFRRKLG